MEAAEIQVGQRYSSTNQSHLGWLVEVIRTSPLQIEIEQISPHKGDRQAYPRESFLRDYVLEHDVKPEHTTINNNISNRVCKVCQEFKPIGDYQEVHINKGKNKGQTAGHYKICRICVAAAKLAGRKKTPALKQRHQPQLSKVILSSTSLSSRLLALATEVERIELQVQPEYLTLLQAARAITQEAEYALGVLVIKQDTFTKLEEAIRGIKE